MASLNVTVPHQLGKTRALERVQQFLESVQRDYAGKVSDVRGQWVDNRLEFGFVASGLPINGVLVVDESDVHVSGPLPFLASMFRGRIEQTIREELERLLS